MNNLALIILTIFTYLINTPVCNQPVLFPLPFSPHVDSVPSCLVTSLPPTQGYYGFPPSFDVDANFALYRLMSLELNCPEIKGEEVEEEPLFCFYYVF